jgi:cytochrome c oxidase subunit 2
LQLLNIGEITPVTRIKNLLGTLFGAVFAIASGDAAAYVFNMPKGVTDISRQVYGLHMMIFWISVVACIAVFAVMIYSIFMHRKDKGAVASTFHESTTVEVIWTTLPMLVLIAVAVPATATLLALEDTRNADLNIQVTGFQWKWRYTYLDEGIEFFSTLDAEHNKIRQVRSGLDPASVEHYLMEVDNPIVVPINQKIRFLITSNDVIHNWWVPALGWKQDAVPGFINDGWTELSEPGTYRGKCAELCGKDHGFMPIVLIAKTEADYATWVDEQKASAAAEANSADRVWDMADLMSKGEQVYNTSCAGCHQVSGAGLPGVFPAIAGSAFAMGDPSAHIDVVFNGATGTAMQAFGAQLSDVDLAAVITYERNAFGNDAGDMVQPATIKALR